MTDPRAPAGDPQKVISKFEQSYTDAVADVYQPKICLSVIGSAFEVQRGGRQTCAIFVGEDVKTQAGPDLKALIASHKQQAAYIDALHEELRRLNTPSYRPVAASAPAAEPIKAAPVSMAAPMPMQSMPVSAPVMTSMGPPMGSMGPPMMGPPMTGTMGPSMGGAPVPSSLTR